MHIESDKKDIKLKVCGLFSYIRREGSISGFLVTAIQLNPTNEEVSIITIQDILPQIKGNVVIISGVENYSDKESLSELIEVLRSNFILVCIETDGSCIIDDGMSDFTIVIPEPLKDYYIHPELIFGEVIYRVTEKFNPEIITSDIWARAHIGCIWLSDIFGFTGECTNWVKEKPKLRVTYAKDHWFLGGGK